MNTTVPPTHAKRMREENPQRLVRTSESRLLGGGVSVNRMHAEKDGDSCALNLINGVV